jgi:two-component system sensor histidine kinase KdpD
MIYGMKITEGLSDSRGILHWVMGTLLAAMATLPMVRLGANSTTAGMVFLVLVVWVSAQAGVWLSVYVALLCALSFDYYFLLPIGTLQLQGIQQWVAMISFLISCGVVSRVAERARSQARHAERRKADVERLYELAQEMMLSQDSTGLIRDLPNLIRRIFALNDVVLYVRDQDRFCASAPQVPETVEHSLREITESRISVSPSPDGFSTQALMLGLRPVGALAWSPDLLSREVATAVSAQVAIALTRATALEVSARLEALREGERLRTALIDSLTHELRTPLTSIRAAATTLMEGEGLDDASRLDLATIVDEEASRLDSLVGEAVEMAEIDAQVVQVRLAPQFPRALLDHAAGESRAALAAHHVVIQVEEPEKPAWFDPHLLGRVLRHLLENAGRYSPPGSRIALCGRRAGERLEFTVEDSGPGIDPSDLPRIFEKFYRGKQGSASRKGSGMGLAIARALIAAHGGGIDVSSVPGQGTIFRFWVPLVEDELARRSTNLHGGETDVFQEGL